MGTVVVLLVRSAVASDVVLFRGGLSNLAVLEVIFIILDAPGLNEEALRLRGVRLEAVTIGLQYLSSTFFSEPPNTYFTLTVPVSTLTFVTRPTPPGLLIPGHVLDCTLTKSLLVNGKCLEAPSAGKTPVPEVLFILLYGCYEATHTKTCNRLFFPTNFSPSLFASHRFDNQDQRCLLLSPLPSRTNRKEQLNLLKQ